MELVTGQMDTWRKGGQWEVYCLIQDTGISVKEVLGK